MQLFSSTSSTSTSITQQSISVHEEAKKAEQKFDFYRISNVLQLELLKNTLNFALEIVTMTGTSLMKNENLVLKKAKTERPTK